MDILKDLWTRLLAYWHKPVAFVALLFILLISLIKVFTSFDLNKISGRELLLICVILLFVYVFWYFSTRLPKTKKGNFGFIVAITSEDNESRDEVLNDLKRNLKTAFEAMSLHMPFQYIVLPKWYAERIEDVNDARKYLGKCRGNFMIFGQVIKRQLHGKDNNVLKLREMVVHRPISLQESAKFSNEMSQIFPNEIRFRERNLCCSELCLYKHE